jgi:hypothetical protein
VTNFEFQKVGFRRARPGIEDPVTSEVTIVGRLTDGRDRAWDMTVRVALDGPEGARAVGMSIDPVGDSLPRLPADVLRGISWPRVLASGLAAMDRPGVRDAFRSALDVFENTPRPGRRGRGDEFYLDWAARYVEIGGDTPVRDLAVSAGLPHATVAHFLDEARRRGLLERPEDPGRPGGQLTPEGKKLLRGQHR